ncbi:nuclear transport factor 2 family protein [Pseudonocardia alaniniphila]|uniref:Nuclear transport factor 2 family protein n=1 Tax=Pseudonocardia alaniniphila TaxID=75291 RepID=A0ABS9T8U7_9PSEU|nr:nuclear transport factor 2 family protein [Pseudonocardia alaniniphila]MCH6164958.1 nuclear transport factor 2 family protein [Pseudonocardia alaniniphila]
MTDTTVASSTRNERAVERYVAFWNADTAEDQQRLASMTFIDDVQYTAPVGVLSGPAALTGFRTQFIDHVGPATFHARENPQTHNDRARLKWEIVTGEGKSFATGTDVMVIDADGLISSVTSFLDRAPEGFDPQAHH